MEWFMLYLFGAVMLAPLIAAVLLKEYKAGEYEQQSREWVMASSGDSSPSAETIFAMNLFLAMMFWFIAVPVVLVVFWWYLIMRTIRRWHYSEG